MEKKRRTFKEAMKQLSYDKPKIDRQAVRIRKSLDDVKKTLEEGLKKREEKKKKEQKEEK